jgi:hypothetical protein
MDQITGYIVIGAIFVALTVAVGKYLFSLGKNKEVDFSLEVDEHHDHPRTSWPRTELKLEVVKSEPVSAKKTAPKKATAKKTAPKKTATKKKPKNTIIS